MTVRCSEPAAYLLLRACTSLDPTLVHLFAGPGVQAAGDHVDPGFLDVSSSFAQGFAFASGPGLDESGSVGALGTLIG